MGSTTAYRCDGPGCSELTTKEPNTRAPEQWLRIIVRMPVTLIADGEMRGAFHSHACAQAWLARWLGNETP